MNLEADRNVTPTVLEPTDMTGTPLSGPLRGRGAPLCGRGVARHRRPATLAALALLVDLALPAIAAAQSDDLPRIGQPGFARGFEGFFDDEGRRAASDERSRPQVMQSSRVSWDCRMFDELATFSMTRGALTVNNVSLRPAIGLLSETPYAELSFSLVNRSTEPRLPTIQLIVYDTTSPLPALVFSTEPLMSIIDGRATEQISQSVNMRPGELDTLIRFCVRIDGWGGQNP